MHHQVHTSSSRSKSANRFKRPMDVVEAKGISPGDKLSILRSWEADERALLRAEDEGMVGGKHDHLHRVKDALDRLLSPRADGQFC
jgi:hypothetical protein